MADQPQTPTQRLAWTSRRRLKRPWRPPGPGTCRARSAQPRRSSNEILPNPTRCRFSVSSNGVRRATRKRSTLSCALTAPRRITRRILNSIGILYRERGDLAASRAALEKAVRAVPGFADAWHNLGSTLAALGEGVGARAAFERSLALNPKQAEALGKYSRFLEARHEIEPARAMAARALDIDPKNALAAMTLADLDARAGDHERAAARIGAALAETGLTPTNRAVFLGMRARALEKLSRHAEAFADCAAANAIVRAQHAEAFAGASGPRSPDTLKRLEAFAAAAPLSMWPKADDFAGPTPVFFVGFPRSGTTMIDQNSLDLRQGRGN